MPNLKYLDNGYQPSREVLNLWLYTRKQENNQINGILIPGIFDTYNFDSDVVWFCTVVCLECAGFYFLYQALSGFELTWLIVLIAVLLDITCAIAAHRNKGTIKLSENKLLYIDNEANKDLEKRKIKKLEIYSTVFKGAIILMALAKIYAVISNNSFGSDSEYTGDESSHTYIYSFGLLAIYSLVAFIHIKYTGYFLSEMYLKYKFNREYNKFITDSGEKSSNEMTEHLIENSENLDITEVFDLRYSKLYKKEGENNTYIIEVKGVLIDDDLKKMAMKQQSKAAMLLIIEEGRKGVQMSRQLQAF